MTDTLLLTYRQAADVLSVSLSSVRRLAKAGDLHVVRPTPHGPRITRASVEALATPGDRS